MPAGSAQMDYKSIGLRLHASSSVISYVFIKRHRSKQEQAPVENAIFVTGLPLGLDEQHTRAVFGCFGAVSQVLLLHAKVKQALTVPGQSHATLSHNHATSPHILGVGCIWHGQHVTTCKLGPGNVFSAMYTALHSMYLEHALRNP